MITSHCLNLLLMIRNALLECSNTYLQFLLVRFQFRSSVSVIWRCSASSCCEYASADWASFALNTDRNLSVSARAACSARSFACAFISMRVFLNSCNSKSLALESTSKDMYFSLSRDLADCLAFWRSLWAELKRLSNAGSDVSVSRNGALVPSFFKTSKLQDGKFVLQLSEGKKMVSENSLADSTLIEQVYELTFRLRNGVSTQKRNGKS